MSQPYILVRADSKRGRRAPSLALKYLVDTSTSHPSEPVAFAEYLAYIQILSAVNKRSAVCLAFDLPPSRPLLFAAALSLVPCALAGPLAEALADADLRKRDPDDVQLMHAHVDAQGRLHFSND